MKIKKSISLPLLFIVMASMTACEISFGNSSSSSYVSDKNSAFINPSSETSSYLQDEDYLPISQIISGEDGYYNTEGVISHIISHENTMDLYLYDPTDNATIYIKNVPNSFFVNPLSYLSVKGYVFHEKNNEIISSCYMEISSLDNISLIERFFDSEYEPVSFSASSWTQSSINYVNHYVELNNIQFNASFEIDNDDFNSFVLDNDMELKVKFDVSKEQEVRDLLLKAYQGKKSISLCGYINHAFDSNHQLFSYLHVVDENDCWIDYQVTSSRNISLYGINDFHGSVKENASNYEAGIIKLGSFLKEKGACENTLLINSGDMWQGSIESNYNHGELLTNCMNYIGFDCFSLGNHEFDWGQEFILKNRFLAGDDGKTINGYQTPFLSANIYRFDINTKTSGEYAKIAQRYTIKRLENGLKVGIIGTIGMSQITSINSPYVDDLTFLDPIDVIKELSDELRCEKGVDVVIVSHHGAQDELVGNGITSISNVSNTRYVDAVFCAHTHQNECTVENQVPFVQAGYNGRSYGNIELTVASNGEVTSSLNKVEYTSSISSSYHDEKLLEIVEKYGEESSLLAKEEFGALDGTLSASDELINLVTKSMSYVAKNNGYDIAYAISNKGRADLNAGTLTYGSVYRSLPFDNLVYIIDAKGKDIRKELQYSSNGMYRLDKLPLEDDKVYRIAVLDYLAFHRNVNRDYNYFPSLSVVGCLTKENYDIYNYRDITCDYLRSLNGKISIKDYQSSLDFFNCSLLDQKI